VPSPLDQSLIATQRSLDALRAELDDAPDKLSVKAINEALLLSLSNQLAIMGGLRSLAAGLGGGAETLLSALSAGALATPATDATKSNPEAESLEEAPPGQLGAALSDTIEVDGVAVDLSEEIAEVSVSLSSSAISAFDKSQGDFERGLKQMNEWLAGTSGTPFQARPKRDFAFLKISGLDHGSVLEREKRLGEYMGYRRRLGRLINSRLEAEVWLYTK